MRIICIDDDVSFCNVIEQEALSVGLNMVFVSSIEQAQKMHNQIFSACILGSQNLEKRSLIKPIKISLVYQNLPEASQLTSIKNNQKIDWIGGKPMSSNEAHYLLTKMCKLSNRLEPSCHWLDEIPENLMNQFLKSNYERLSIIATLIQKIKISATPDVWQELQNIVHKISGSAGMYGRTMAGELCKEMEIKLKNKDYADLDTFYRQLFLYIQ